ncbi:MAG: GYF domain-containing protein [Candidatus Obscuribacterales bacterium]|nr:GYF domain-containing protein [Candidatus Obscuribacterales bacterium]
MQNAEWFYLLNSQQVGPVSQDELETLFSSGKLSGNTGVWATGMAAWVSASTVPAFSRVLNITAPAAMASATAQITSTQEAQQRLQNSSEQASILEAVDKPSKLIDQPQGAATTRNESSNITNADVSKKYPAGQSRSTDAWQKLEIFYASYFKNAYRVLGITGSSTQADLKKTVANIRRQAKIGKPYTSPHDMNWAGPPVSRAEKDILDAETKLLNPETRIQQRLLWFHSPPEEIPTDISREAAAATALKWAQMKDPVALHDAAVLMQFAAIADSPEFERKEYWQQAIALWKQVLADESYWNFLCEIDDQLGFEPVCLSSDVYAQKESFIELVTEPITLVSKDALNRSNQGLFARAVSLINASPEETSEASHSNSATSEIKDEFHRMMDAVCQEIATTLSNKVDKNEKTYKKHKQANIDVCGQCESIFKFEVEKILENARAVLPETDLDYCQLKEEAAVTLEGIGNAYTWADDYVNAIRVLEQALVISEGTSAEPKIRESLDNSQKNLEMAKMFGEQKRVNSAPALYTMNACGFMIYPAIGEKPEPYLGSKRAIYYLVLIMLPIFPLASYRVIFNPNGTYSFLSQIPLDKFARIHQAVVALAISFLVIGTATYKPSAKDLARQAAEISQNTDLAIQRTHAKVQLPLDKYDLKKLIESDEQALNDLEGRVLRVKPVLESKMKELDASYKHLEALKKENKTSADEMKELAAAHNAKADEFEKMAATYDATVTACKKILAERNDAADYYNQRFAHK